MIKSLFLALALVGCASSTQNSRSTMLTSIHASTMSLRSALLAYDSSQVASILQTATSGSDAKAKVTTLHAREQIAEKALDTADAAVATAVAVNDDPSLKGAEAAVEVAVTALNDLFGGK